jgi:hypothetical protein
MPATAGQALEVISGYTIAEGTTYTALTMNGSDSATIRSFDMTKSAYLLAQWGYTTLTGHFRIRSPRLHDNVQGIHIITPALNTDPQLHSLVFKQPLYAQDTLIFEMAANAANAGDCDIGAALIYYPELPGVQGNFISPANLDKNGKHIMGQWVTITPVASGNYTGQVAINSTNDNFQANMWYALLGAVTDLQCGVIRVQGVDIGNLGVGIPGAFSVPSLASRWFVFLSQAYNLPLIPCFNSANKGSIFVSICQNQTAAATHVYLLMVLLGPTISPGV